MTSQQHIKTDTGTDFDAIVVGAGFSGLYMLHRLREAGISTCVYEAGDNVGGTWYWNRYPGLRCDSESIYYNYTFSKEIYQEWTWSSRYAAQPEILRYLNFVADKLELRKDIQFNTRIVSAHYNEQKNRWEMKTDNGENVTAKYFIPGLGCLSAANVPNLKGIDTFKGECYHSGRWPRDREVDFKGKRVGIIGTGSTGIQMIPFIAKRASHLTVFQRTPQYVIPARNRPLDTADIENVKENFEDISRKMRYESDGGVIFNINHRKALDDTPEQRQKFYEQLWEKGGTGFLAEGYSDLLTNEEANETAAEFVRSKIRQVVNDPKVAEKLMPTYPIGTKRIIIDTNYYDTYNRDNVTLVDVNSDPIEEITPSGVRTNNGEYELDILVFATGYDAMTGPLMRIDIRGKEGISLKEKWEGGAQVSTYLGLTVPGFPNMFTITGPQSPSVLGNVPSMIEQHVEWISNCIEKLCKQGVETIEATEEAAESWSKHCSELASYTLIPKTDSWWTGSNVDGKPRAFLIYIGGLQAYRQKCDEVTENNFEGFIMTPSAKTVV
jgi:cation diffusion facilitator CzcD-associated flavoprotein CzcO